MFPVLFRIADFEITSFGVLVGVAAIVAIQIFAREIARARLPEAAVNAAMAGVIGGLVGAKVIWSLEFAGTAPFHELLFSRGGLSWFGGFVGGVGTGILMLRLGGVPLMPALSAAAPALAVGHAIGRIGCFLVGDDYGRPSVLPWAVAFPRGLPPTTVPVHPTQLYETLALGVVAWWLVRWRREGVADPVVFGRYLVMAAAVRFAIEFVRINAPVLGPLTVAQLWALAIAAAGFFVMRWRPAVSARASARASIRR